MEIMFKPDEGINTTCAKTRHPYCFQITKKRKKEK